MKRKKKDEMLDNAHEELRRARKFHDEVIDQTREVVKITAESREHQRNNGFYTLFMAGLRGRKT